MPENLNFPNLKVFNCSNNKLTSLPDNMNFPNLQEFYCYNNQLTSLPELPPNLEILCCKYNKLKQLPKEVIEKTILNSYSFSEIARKLFPKDVTFFWRANVVLREYAKENNINIDLFCNCVN